jgi:signal transduction histidine kinase
MCRFTSKAGHQAQARLGTKKDVGTGLGLWLSKEIVQRHGGEIKVISSREPDHHGATFVVRLPCQSLPGENISPIH